MQEELQTVSVMQIAKDFIDASASQLALENRVVDSLEDSSVRDALSKQAPHLSKLYEGKTKDELVEQRLLRAVAFGVAYAIHRALQP